MKLYMLSYDRDTGSREDWSIFYTPVEAFSSEDLRNQRIEELKKAVDDIDDEPLDYEFHTYEVHLDNIKS